MNILVSYLLNGMLTALEVGMLFLLGRCFFQPSYKGCMLFVSLITLLAIHISIYFISHQWILLKCLCFLFCDSVWIKLAFKQGIVPSGAISAVFLSIMMAGDSLFLMGFHTITGGDARVFIQNPYGYYAFCYIVKVFELFLIVVLRLILKKRTEFLSVTWHDWIRTLSFPVMSIFIAGCLMQLYISNDSAAPQVLLCSCALIISDFLAIGMLNYMEQQQTKLRDYAVLKHSVRIEQENVEAWMNAYSNQRKQTHEYQNQLAVISGMAKEEAPNGQLIEYVTQLQQTSLSESLLIKTGQTVVDVLLNQKYALAQSKDISFDMDLDDLSDFILSGTDLVVVLSNLIDNAIEACSKIIDPAQRMIQLSMRSNPDSNIVRIDNTTAEPVKIVNNTVLTTKGTLEHGYGLKNIASILSNYDSIYVLDYQTETHMFCFSAQIIPQ